jgi:hypothetical protein
MISLLFNLTKKGIRQLVKTTLLPHHQAIVKERSRLINKKYSNRLKRLSRKDQSRLNSLDKKLDLIEDSLNGNHLDKLENIVKAYKKTAKTISKKLRKYR